MPPGTGARLALGGRPGARGAVRSVARQRVDDERLEPGREHARHRGRELPDGKVALGGGAYVTTTSSNKGRVQLVGSFPSAAGQWTAVAAVNATLGGNTLDHRVRPLQPLNGAAKAPRQ